MTTKYEHDVFLLECSIINVTLFVCFDIIIILYSTRHILLCRALDAHAMVHGSVGAVSSGHRLS
jgi:hypothetical protein